VFEKSYEEVSKEKLIEITNDDILTSSSKSKKQNRYPVTQQQIDEILNNELKDYVFPVKPIYNSRIKDNGKTNAAISIGGTVKRIKSIEIGKQDEPDRKFLVDTLLHEYLEAEIFIKRELDPFYEKLDKPTNIERHKWIELEIIKFFDRLEGKR